MDGGHPGEPGDDVGARLRRLGVRTEPQQVDRRVLQRLDRHPHGRPLPRRLDVPQFPPRDQAEGEPGRFELDCEIT